MFKKYRTGWIFLVIAIALAVYFFSFKHKAPDSKQASAKKSDAQTTNTNAALTVNTVKISRSMLNVIIPANGNIAPWQEAVVGAEVNGLLLNEVLVNVGDKVKRGQILARFASGTISADLAQASANLAEAKAAAIEAASNAKRAKSIQDTGALSTQQIEQYLSAEASTKAHVEAAQATLNLQNIKLKQTTVNAPDDGVISSRTATVGSVAAVGQELFKLVRKGRLEWRAELTSADINKIRIGMKADLILPDGQKIIGKVRAIAPSIDSQTRNALLYVDIPAETAKAGMYARGVFVLENTEAYTLPADAIVLRDGFSYAMQVISKPND
ncbi:MAG: efflux RND transporter periplasmic adaptor subunit, partial [Pseudomonadota bacterium]